MKAFFENAYRSKSCGELRLSHVGERVRLAGWVESIRDHGGIQFIDLRDYYGVTQVVVHDEAKLAGVCRETVISVSGPVLRRSEDTYNPKLATGEVELSAEELDILGVCKNVLPFEIQDSRCVREETRLKYRFLDLRSTRLKENMILRSRLIAHLRDRMTDMGFLEVQTPILSASSPEGARDYLVPSRKYPGKFYALPQAPQIFKQLLMVAGVDRYFQVAPCFRDEDSRADRSPGEFYQLDFEMAFATQDEVLQVAEELMYDTFSTFSSKSVAATPFPRISYRDAMLRYGTDKPDLRNPLEIIELSDLFAESSFAPFRGQTVRGIRTESSARMTKGFFEKMLDYALSIGMKGLGYLRAGDQMELLGPIAKYLSETDRDHLIRRAGMRPGDVLFFIADVPERAPELAGQIRSELGRRLDLCSDDYRFCFVVDFPMYETDPKTGLIGFTHNPFSMPQGGAEALEHEDPLSVLAWQYDLVCNGEELSSGAVRNHDLPTMLKAFAIAGYSAETVEKKFGALYNAFQYGAPPHAGMAPGIDRMLMLLTGETSIREVIPFPMSASAQDLMLGAPGEVSRHQLREANIEIR